jgi:hypothetical protein
MGIDRIVGSHVSRVLLVTAFGFGTLASGHAFEVTEQQRAACTPDAFRLCSSEIPDADRVAACMEDKKASLSAPCRAVFVAAGSDPSVAHPSRKVHLAYAHHHRLHGLGHYARYHEFYAHHHKLARS